MKNCPSCQAQARDEAAFCPNCGHRIEAGSDQVPGAPPASWTVPPAPPTRARRIPVPAIVAAVVVVAAGVIVPVVLLTGGGTKGGATQGGATRFTREGIVDCLRGTGVSVDADAGILLHGAKGITVDAVGGRASTVIFVFESDQAAESSAREPIFSSGEADARANALVYFAPDAAPNARSAIDSCVPPGAVASRLP